MKMTLENVEMSDRHRGQIMVLTVFIICILIIAAVGVMNTATISEVERADGPDINTQTATVAHSDVTRELEMGVRNINHDPTLEGQVVKESNVNSIIDEIEFLYGISEQHYGTSVTIDGPSEDEFDTQPGTRITQVLRSDVTSVDGDKDWTPVENAEDVRSITFNVESVTSIHTGENTPNEEQFKVIINHVNGDSYDIRVTRGGGQNNILVEYGESGSSSFESCTITEQYGSSFTLGITSGEFIDRQCPNYPIDNERIESVSIENGHQIEDTRFSMVTTDTGSETFSGVNTTDSAPSTQPSDGEEENNGEDPVAHPAIYSAEASIRITSDGALIESDRILAPGTRNPYIE